MISRYEVTGVQARYEPGSNERVLANKLGIHDPSEMEEAELVLLQKLYEWVLRDQLPRGAVTVALLRLWHRRWLGNVYAWAGQVRTVNMSKGGFPFAPAAQLPRLLNDFEKQYLQRCTPCYGLNRAELVRAIAVIHVEFILLHPFRDGNGRISRLLADVMAVQGGHGPLDYTSWELNRAGYIAAVQHGLTRDYQPMEHWVAQAIQIDPA